MFSFMLYFDYAVAHYAELTLTVVPYLHLTYHLKAELQRTDSLSFLPQALTAVISHPKT